MMSAAMATNKDTHSDREVVTRERVKKQVRPPRMYRVVFHNDDYTTQHFVVAVLRAVFNKTPDEATELMLRVHYEGYAIVGIYPYEIAETKVARTIAEARAQEFPLEVTMEPAEE
jgi:ATP-dependent Clp protease adaptor protein ClpS